MITQINLPLRVPFNKEQAVLDDMRRICFVFGPNGSGMSSRASRYRQPGESGTAIPA